MRDFTDQFVTDYLAQHMMRAAQADLLARAPRDQGFACLGVTTRVGRPAVTNF